MDQIANEINVMRAKGYTLKKIAKHLNDLGITTAHGNKWTDTLLSRFNKTNKPKVILRKIGEMTHTQ